MTERTTAESIETLQEQLSTSLSLVDNLEKEKEDHVRQIDDLQTVVSDLTKMLASTLSELNATKTANAQEKVEMESHYRAQLKRVADDHDAEMDGLVRQMNSLEQMVLRSKSEKGQAAATAARTSPAPVHRPATLSGVAVAPNLCPMPVPAITHPPRPPETSVPPSRRAPQSVSLTGAVVPIPTTPTCNPSVEAVADRAAA